jgi:hypothetical protein
MQGLQNGELAVNVIKFIPKFGDEYYFAWYIPPTK